jgi:ornithine cyclodeaminase/alanine dehydrogenase-like protein (mu-crystallin family)
MPIRRIVVSKASFIYLSQEDAIKYGAADVAATNRDVERTVVLTYQGKAIEAPTATLFWDVDPDKLKGPFVGYPSKKRANIHAGFLDDDGVKKVAIKNIPSNPDNPKNGYGPRASGLVTILDSESGYPLALMDAMVISCMRTGCLGALGVKYLRSSTATTVALIGVGPINQAAILATADVMPELKKAYVFDFDDGRARKFADKFSAQLGIEIVVCATAKDAIVDADVVIPATSVQNKDAAYIEYGWLKKGALFVDLSLWDAKYEVFEKADAMFTNSDLVMERKTMTPACLVTEGITTEEKLIDIGGVISGETAGRRSDRDIIVYFARGMALYDVMSGYRVYENARKAQEAPELSLWEQEFWL